MIYAAANPLLLVLFNIMNTSGEYKVMTFKEIMNTVFSKGDLK